MRTIVTMMVCMCMAVAGCTVDSPTTATAVQDLICHPCDPADVDALLDATMLYGESLFWGAVSNGWTSCDTTEGQPLNCSAGFTACPAIGSCFQYIAECGGNGSCRWYR
jgi:hypothetical protein